MQLLRGPKMTGEDKTGSTKRKSWGSSNTRRALPFGLFLFLATAGWRLNLYVRSVGKFFFFIILKTREVALLKDSSYSSSLVGCCFSTCFECLVVMLPVKRATSVLHNRTPLSPTSSSQFTDCSPLCYKFFYTTRVVLQPQIWKLLDFAWRPTMMHVLIITKFSTSWSGFFGLVETERWAKSRVAIFWIQMLAPFFFGLKINSNFNAHKLQYKSNIFE